MLKSLNKSKTIKRIKKTMKYARTRQYFPMAETSYINDRDKINDAEIVKIDWPEEVTKPIVGVVRDFEPYPFWTKYCRFLENNNFNYEIYNIHSRNWIDESKKYNVIIGLVSNTLFHLEEIRNKYYFLEKYLGKKCFPSPDHTFLYESKSLEQYLSEIYNIPYAKTAISHDKDEALELIKNMRYPFISKVDPSSGSFGVELIRTPSQAQKLIKQAFSRNGRKVHVNYFRQKNYVYFQEFIPNDGYDIRIILVGNWAFGYYRKVLQGDFRASGMNMVEKRELSEEAIRTAWNTNQLIKSPLLVVDMVHGLDGRYTIVEFSPICQMETPEQLHANGVPGMYIIENDGSIHFEKGRYWVHELALREFFLKEYIPNSVKGLNV